MTLPKKKLEDEALSDVNGGGYFDCPIEKPSTTEAYCTTCDARRTFELHEDGYYYCRICGSRLYVSGTMV